MKKDLNAEIADKMKELQDLSNKKRLETQKEIEKLAKDSGYFCGIILDNEALLTVLRNALDSGKSVKIPFSLYNL